MKNKVGFAIASITLLFAGFFWLTFNYQSVIDNFVVSQFKPTAQITGLADDIQFTQHGRFLFMSAQPELSDRDSFNKYCEKKAEQTVVLGCYISPQNLYIYNITDKRLSGVRQVTAAHEMLHVAYDRLSYSDKQKVDSWVEAALPTVVKDDPDLAERLKVYEKTEPGERQNELHSILGTEAKNLPKDLENYYKKYFIDRSIITKLAASYDKVFEEIKNQQNQLVQELNLLVDKINTETEQYNQENAALNHDIQAFNQRAGRQGGFSSETEFYATRNELVLRSNALEEKREFINSMISEYEEKHSQLDAVNIKVKELNKTIDSTSVPSI